MVLKTGRFDNTDPVVIISSVFQFCTASFTLLMMIAKSMLSKRPVLRFTLALFFLELFWSYIYCIPIIFFIIRADNEAWNSGSILGVVRLV